MKKVILILAILFSTHSYSQEIITTYDGVIINKNDTLFVGYPSNNGYCSYVREVGFNTVTPYPKGLKYFDKLVVIKKVIDENYFWVFHGYGNADYQKKETLLCKNINNGKQYYMAINEAIKTDECFTSYIKHGLTKEYYGVKTDNDALYKNVDIIYLWYKQSSLPEYAKIKKYIEIKYPNAYNSIIKNGSNEIFNTYKEEINNKLSSLNINQVYSMKANFKISTYDENNSKLKIISDANTYENFDNKLENFISLKCNNYPNYFNLDIDNQQYFALSKHIKNDFINAIVNYEIIEKSIYDDDDDIRIKIVSIDFYDNVRIVNNHIGSNYYGTVHF